MQFLVQEFLLHALLPLLRDMFRSQQGPSSGVYTVARELIHCWHTDHAPRATHKTNYFLLCSKFKKLKQLKIIRLCCGGCLNIAYLFLDGVWPVWYLRLRVLCVRMRGLSWEWKLGANWSIMLKWISVGVDSPDNVRGRVLVNPIENFFVYHIGL